MCEWCNIFQKLCNNYLPKPAHLCVVIKFIHNIYSALIYKFAHFIIQAPKDGGLGISVAIINIIFFIVIIASVSYIAISRHEKHHGLD